MWKLDRLVEDERLWLSDGKERKAIWQWLNSSYMPIDMPAKDDLMRSLRLICMRLAPGTRDPL
jgi:hypothetical protein